MNKLFGLPVFVNDMLVPVKSLPAKQWHARGGRYAQRINKKWAKKYGMKKYIGPNDVITTPQGYFVSSEGLETLKRGIKS